MALLCIRVVNRTAEVEGTVMRFTSRAGILTKDDLALLNSKVVTSLFVPELENTTTITKLNYFRHLINRTQMEHFARTRSQNIYIFPASHSRTKSLDLRSLPVKQLLQQTDQGTQILFPGLFLYTMNT